MKKARYAVCVVAVGATAVALTASPALAARVKSHLVVEQAGVDITGSTITLSQSSPDTDVTTHLDGRCSKVFENAADKTFGVTATPDASNVQVQTPNYSGQKCDSTQTWHLHAVGGNGFVTIQFDPVTTETGLQNQMGPAQITVEVTGFGDGNGDNPPGHKRPAAPAVANVHVPPGSDLADQCKAHYGGVHNWRGLFMKDIITWSRANHLNKVKQTYSSDDAWAQFVDEHVDGLCTPQS